MGESSESRVKIYIVGTGRLKVVAQSGERPHLEIGDATADTGVVCT